VTTNARNVSTFWKFFVDKVNRIRSNIAAALQSTLHYSPERVHQQALPRSGIVVLPAGDNRGGAPAVVCYAVQLVTARRAAMLVTEGMH